MDLNKLETRELGKYFEQLLASQLIKLGFEIFVPVLDKGIDFILRKEDEQVRYYEVQVKSVRRKGGRLTIRKDFFPNRENLFLAFFNVGEEGEYDAYLIPAKEVHKIFHPQEQRGKSIWRLNTTRKDLEKIQAYKWSNPDDVPEVWLNATLFQN